MSKIKLITDSASDIRRSVAQRRGIRIIPLTYSFDGETYLRSEIDETCEEFYERLEKSETIPKTAQITPAQFSDIFREEVNNGYDTIIMTTISSKGSGTFQNANIAANEVMDEMKCDIRVVDSMNYACAYGAPLIHASHMIEEGADADEIEKYITEATADFRYVFVVGSLEHLKKGGRINAATLVFANMLDIKPILTIPDGVVVQSDKIRGTKRVNKKLIDYALETAGTFEGRTVITVDANVPEKVDALDEELRSRFPDIKLHRCKVGAIIGTHTGHDLIGIGFSASGRFDYSDYEEE